MPEYPFRTSDGRDIDLYFPMSEAPEIGSTIVVDGQELTRLPSATAGRGTEEGSVGYSLPLWDPAAKHHTPEGRPAFPSKQDRLNYQARTNGRYVWDP